MKYSILLMAVVLSLSMNVGADDFYDINTINTIEITFEESNWDAILDVYYAAGNEERLVGTAVINGIQFDSVGVRYKGNSTYRPNQTKNPLNIKLDHIIDDQTYDGYGTLKLANVWDDPSFIRETLSYEIARKYMPASKANYIKVTINGTYIGLYTSVQDVDKFFARNNDLDDDGARFKGVLSDGLMSSVNIWGYEGSNPSLYYDNFELESDEGWDEMVNFLDVLNNSTANVDEVLNVDRHLWMIAFDILLVNLDAPVNVDQNYYVFQDYSNRFNPIIWDLNMSFGGFTQLRSTGNLSTTQMKQLSPLVHSTDSRFSILNKVLSNTTYKKMYLAHLKTMVDENFANSWYETRGGELQDIIATEVQNDPNKFFTYSAFLTNLTSSAGNKIGITQLMDARVSYLSGQTFYTATPPTITNILHSPETVLNGTTIAITATATNMTSVLLGYHQNNGQAFTVVSMYDDGAHGDGAASDGVYGAYVDVNGGDIMYYIYAENSNVGIFSPARAEFEYYTITVSSSGDNPIRINEFMADNDNIIADQDSEYDDWIELYNSADTAISLNGHYLTDDDADLTQWTFPDTSIAGNGYLLIWADDNEEQVGLHANFKLSASGESIILSEPDQTIIDEVTFGEQTTDISYGRYPDGAENWQFFSTPTPEASNTVAVNQNPVIEWMMRIPEIVTDDDSVYVVAKVTDESAVALVNLTYIINSSQATEAMLDNGLNQDSLSGDNIYGFAIPPQVSGTVVEYYVTAQDDSGATVTDPTDPGTQRYSYEVGAMALPLYINEFMADNESAFEDPDESGTYPDWIEIYNAGTSSIDMGGMYMSDDLENPTKWQIPTGVTIEAGGYLVFLADEDEEQGDLHTGFKLGASGEAVGLFDIDVNNNVTIDTVTFGEQKVDTTYGRCPDGNDTWVFMGVITPGSANNCFICGDANGNGSVNILDVTFLINYLYRGGPAPNPSESADVNNSLSVNILDATYLINYLYRGGPAPNCP
nr:CotH kinase family protein [candidate division Zixibacteria bacterium]